MQGRVGCTAGRHLASEMRDVKIELMQVREFGRSSGPQRKVCREKTEIAARRLDRMERVKDEVDDAEHEVTLQEALMNSTKVVKLAVGKWFVFSFGKAPRVKSSSSTPASCKAPWCSWSALTHGRKS